MKRALFIAVLCLIAGLLSSCGAISKSNYLVDRPVVIYPKTIVTQEDETAIKTKSMQALLESFEAYKWEIHRLDKAEGVVVAEACRMGQHCIEVEASIKEDGSVEIIRTPGQEITENEAVMLKRWLGRLKKAYNKKLTAISGK